MSFVPPAPAFSRTLGSTEQADPAFAVCKPVLIEQNRKTIQTGSCSFLLLGGEHFLITARHVLESHGSGPYFVGTRQGRFYLDRGHYKSSLCPQRDDKHDIAIYPLNDEDLEKLQGTGFITRDMVCTTTFPESPALVIGYPNSKNKKIPPGSPARVEVHGIATQTLSVPTETARRYGTGNEANFFVHYGREDKKAPQLMSPTGMSGGIVMIQLGGKALVAGIPIEYHKNMNFILCTHYNLVCNSVERLIGNPERPDKAKPA
ncbi:hypothetical protein [Pseudomonas aeruginosa]|uniref:hypothetical protein n=1 Tax=Pseudomonas aeruginosa TaxID=287 RepID=UPI000D696B11|nr:hypothetical protein [Pseudomonas aeruginosa]